MPQTIEVVVRMTLSEEDFDVSRLEERVQQVRDEAGRELLVKVFKVRDEAALAAHPGAVRQRRVARHVDTTLGHVVFRRWRVQAAGKTTWLLDRRRGLARQRRVRPAVTKRASELASRLTYREASTVLREELRTAVSGQSVHRWVQPLAEAVEERELILPSAPASRSAPEVVVAEGDETLVRSQEKGEEHFAMKLGIGYRQKERQGPQPWKLADKVAYGGVEEPEVFAGRC